jgi:hypothetical protein
MTISYQTNGSVVVQTKNHTVRLGDTVQLDEYTIPGAGEFDVAAIQCEAYSLAEGTVYFVHSEDITVSYFSGIAPGGTKLEEASSTNILVVDVKSNDQADKLKAIVKSMEPSYVFLIGSGATPEFRAELGLNAYENSTLKVSRTGLPLEGTWLIPN